MLGMRGRGLGLNCPGDPGCPGYVAPGSADYQTSLLQEILANQYATVDPYGASVPVVAPAAAPSTFTGWLNANSTTVLIGAAVFAGLALFMGRR